MGANMTIQNQAGETPRDVARRFGQLACVKILGGDPGILHIMAALIPSCTREMKFNSKTMLYTTYNKKFRNIYKIKND